MKTKRTLIQSIRLRIKKRKDNSFILKDFSDFIEKYDYDQVLRALRNMVNNKELIKIGRGIYAKTRTFLNGKTALKASVGEVANEALQKFGIKTGKSSYWNMYNAGLTTQVPTGRVIAVNKRVRRNIAYNGYKIDFEPMNNTYKKQPYNYDTRG